MSAILGAQITSTLLTKKGLGEVQRTSNRISGLEIRDNLKKRFEGHRGGLRFRRRSNNYNRRKRKEVGHIIPLLYRGHMRRSVITRARVTATAKQGRVVTATGARGFRSAEWRKQVRQEIEQIPEQEERALAKSQRKTISTLANNPRFHKRTVRKV